MRKKGSVIEFNVIAPVRVKDEDQLTRAGRDARWRLSVGRQMAKAARDKKWMITNEPMSLEIILYYRRPGLAKKSAYPIRAHQLGKRLNSILQAAEGTLCRRATQVVSVTIHKRFVESMSDIPYIHIVARRCE